MNIVHGIRLVCIPALLAAMTMIGSNDAQAKIPDAPTDLVTHLTNCPNSGYLYLTWSPVPDLDQSSGYHIYQASGETTDLSAFEMLAQQDVPIGSGYTKSGGYSVIPLPVGTFSFYVTAFNADGESQPGTIVTRTVRKLDIPLGTALSDSIGFTLQPTPAELETKIGEEILVDLKPRNFSTKQMQFSLLLNPEGMTIDPATGVVRWVPQEEGNFPFVVRASYVDNPDVGNILDSKITVVEGTSGLEDETRSTEVLLYPNPTTSLLRVMFPSTNIEQRLSLWNISGVEILEAGLESGASVYVLDTAPYPNGSYFLRISGGDHVRTLPVTITH